MIFRFLLIQQSSQPFFPQKMSKITKLSQAEQSERFPVLDLPGKKCWSQTLWEDFFTSQVSLGQMAMLVAYRSLSSWEEVLRIYRDTFFPSLTSLNRVRSPLNMSHRCQWLPRPSLSGAFFGGAF